MDTKRYFLSAKGKATLFFAFILAGLLSFSVSGDDKEANTAFLKARELEKEGKYQRAASYYKDAQHLADSLAIKGNSLIAASRNFRKAELYGEEFDCLNSLVQDHLTGIDFSRVVERMYRIGDLYFQGHRDTPVAWLPFLKKEDRTIEVYEAALKFAPCMPDSAETRLRLARLHIDSQNIKRAMFHLTEISKLHAGTRAAHDAILELASILFQLAKNGDGDNAYSRRTLEVLDEFEEKYPASEEMPWVRKHRQLVLDFIAGRLDAIGSFYQKIGRKDTAGQYYADVVKNYADTRQAAKTEEKLAKIEKDYKIPAKRPVYKPYTYSIGFDPDVEEATPVKTAPEESNNRWLLPVRDYKKSIIVNPGELDELKKKSEEELNMNNRREVK